MSVFGGTQGGKTGILALFQPPVGPQSSTYPEFPDGFIRRFLGNQASGIKGFSGIDDRRRSLGVRLRLAVEEVSGRGATHPVDDYGDDYNKGHQRPEGFGFRELSRIHPVGQVVQ